MAARSPIILASGSRYRRELLGRLFLPFSFENPDIDESALAGETPANLAQRLSREKARCIASRHTAGLIIGSDQVADCDGRVLGKPDTVDQAVAQLQVASGRTVTFWTGLALVNAATGRAQETVVRCDVDFRDLTASEIRRYVEIEQPLDCAGSFKAEGLGIVLFRRYVTDDPTSLVGLPLIALCNMLRAEGIALPPEAD